jgi:GAF domain-containing protein/nitrogen-specific signal transduction histidine kinase
MNMDEALAILRGQLDQIEGLDPATKNALLATVEKIEGATAHKKKNSKKRDSQTTLADLESRIWDRTEGLVLRATRLTAISELTSRITSIRDPKELLDFVVAILAERFGFFYVGVYQVDPAQEELHLTQISDEMYRTRVADTEWVKLLEPGILSWTALYRKPQFIRDTHIAPITNPQGLLPQTRLRLVLPLISGNELLGVIDLQSPNPDSLDEDEAQSLASVAHQISTALENARLFAAEQRQRQIADMLREISLLISTLTMVDQEDALELMLEQIGRVIDYDAASIWVDRTNGAAQFQLAAQLGYEAFGPLEQIERLILSAERYPIVEDLCTSNKIIVIPDVNLDDRWVLIQGFEWIRSWVGIRISVKGKPIGILTLNHHQPSYFIAHDQTLLEALAIQLSVAIENVQLLQAERHQREIATTLRDIGTVLTSSLDQAIILKRVLEQVTRVLPYDAAGIWIDDGTHMLRMVMGIGYDRFGVEERSKQLAYPRSRVPFIGNLNTAKRAITVPDTHDLVNYKPQEGYEWIRSWASALLVVRGRPIGNLALDHTQPGFYGPQHETILEALATQFSIAIENAELFQAERQQREVSETLRDTGLVLTSTLDHDTVLKHILEQVARIVPFDAAGIWLFDEHRIRRLVASVGYDRFNLTREAQTLTFNNTTDTLSRQLQNARQVLMISDVHVAPDWVVYPGFEWVKSWIAAPIIVNDEVIGILSLDHSQPKSYTLSDIPILEQFAVQISIAVRNANLYTALENSERRTRAMLDAVPDLMFRYNRQGDYLSLVVGGDAESPVLRNNWVGHNVREVLSSDFAAVILTHIERTLATSQMQVFEYSLPGHEGVKDYEARMVVCGADEVLCMVRNITERKQAEKDIQHYMEELKRSNEELQQFAYVASHDLQEPLRMIASYLQLLSKRYKGKLGSDADDFIDYAVDGAHRLQHLINDLLLYSRVGTQGKPLEPTEMEVVLDHALNNLGLAIEENRAEITHDPLPNVQGDAVQLVALFQNLVGNAIKFHGEAPPRIHISARPVDACWRFSVKDNGIGISPEYADRIFAIFKRLHTAAEYPGTGIGLAVCKRIVERHGGRIWVESAPKQGATFYFILQAANKD